MTAFREPGTARLQAGRFPLALAASAGLHLLLTSTLSGLPEGGAGRFVRVPMTVRLEVPTSAPAPEKAEPPARSDDGHVADTWKETRAGHRPDSSERSQRSSEPVPLRARRDTKVYAALELDTLPSAARPIEIGWLHHDTPVDRYRVELTIDERGFVERFAVLDPSPAGPVERRLRAAFEETRFSPAHKDGLAVRSRIVLHVGFGSGEGTR